MRRLSAPAAASLSLGLLLAVATARADPPRCGEPPSDEEVRRRLDLLDTHIRSEEPGVRRWFSSFVALHSTMAGGAALIAGFAEDEGFRNEMLVTMTSSSLAVISLLVTLPPLLGAGDQLRGYDEDTPEARHLKMRAAESLLRRDSDSIDFMQSWFPITMTSLYTASASVFNLVALERVRAAYTHAIGGAIIGLGRVLLRPMGPRDRWQRYRRAFPDAGCEVVARAPSPSLRVVAAGVGLGLRLDF